MKSGCYKSIASIIGLSFHLHFTLHFLISGGIEFFSLNFFSKLISNSWFFIHFKTQNLNEI